MKSVRQRSDCSVLPQTKHHQFIREPGRVVVHILHYHANQNRHIHDGNEAGVLSTNHEEVLHGSLVIQRLVDVYATEGAVDPKVNTPVPLSDGIVKSPFI